MTATHILPASLLEYNLYDVVIDFKFSLDSFDIDLVTFIQ